MERFSLSVEVESPEAAIEEHIDEKVGHCGADEGSVGEEPQRVDPLPAGAPQVRGPYRVGLGSDDHGRRRDGGGPDDEGADGDLPPGPVAEGIVFRHDRDSRRRERERVRQNKNES